MLIVSLLFSCAFVLSLTSCDPPDGENLPDCSAPLTGRLQYWDPPVQHLWGTVSASEREEAGVDVCAAVHQPHRVHISLSCERILL
eukprot:754935-Hanusia_phi.AAC.3